MRLFEKISKFRIHITLLSILFFIVLYSLTIKQNHDDSVPTVGSFFILIVVPAFSMFLKTRRLLICASIITLLTVGLIVIAKLTNNFIVINLVIIAEFIFFSLTFLMVIRYINAYQQITLHEVLTAILGYLLLAILFALLFTFATLHQPESIAYAIPTQATTHHYWHFSDMIYFSLVTLTSLGYGDIVPMTDTARMLAALEAVAGQMYLAIFIARLIGLMVSQKANKKINQNK